MTKVNAHIDRSHYKTILTTDTHLLVSDEPKSLGGTDYGVTPKDLLASALGACTAITIRMYADRKGWPVETVDVKVEIEKSTTDSNATVFKRNIKFTGDLSKEQLARLMSIADACPIHKILKNPAEFETILAQE